MVWKPVFPLGQLRHGRCLAKLPIFTETVHMTTFCSERPWARRSAFEDTQSMYYVGSSTFQGGLGTSEQDDPKCQVASFSE